MNNAPEGVRRVRVFELRETDTAVSMSVSYVRLRVEPTKPLVEVFDRDAYVAKDCIPMCVRDELVPVHEYRYQDGESVYVAMPGDVRDMFVSAADDVWRARIKAAKAEAEAYSRMYMELSVRVRAFEQMPWWKRVWRAARGTMA